MAQRQGGFEDEKDIEVGEMMEKYGKLILNAAAYALMQKWYRKAQNRVFGKNGKRRNITNVEHLYRDPPSPKMANIIFIVDLHIPPSPKWLTTLAIACSMPTIHNNKNHWLISMQILHIDWFPHNSHVEKGQEKKTRNKAPLLFGGKKQNKTKKCQVERSGVTWRTQR
jgi:hypothetical protein